MEFFTHLMQSTCFDGLKEVALMSNPFKLLIILLVAGFFSGEIICWHCQAQDVNPGPPPVVKPPNQIPDSQRFRPETVGDLIKRNRERVEEYKAVPPPEVSPETKPKKEEETPVK
jgi:hypothetical protein